MNLRSQASQWKWGSGFSPKPRCDFRVEDWGRKSLTDSLKKTETHSISRKGRAEICDGLLGRWVLSVGRTVSTSTAVRDRRWASGSREGMVAKVWSWRLLTHFQFSNGVADGLIAKASSHLFLLPVIHALKKIYLRRALHPRPLLFSAVLRLFRHFPSPGLCAGR